MSSFPPCKILELTKLFQMIFPATDFISAETTTQTPINVLQVQVSIKKQPVHNFNPTFCFHLHLKAALITLPGAHLCY